MRKGDGKGHLTQINDGRRDGTERDEEESRRDENENGSEDDIRDNEEHNEEKRNEEQTSWESRELLSLAMLNNIERLSEETEKLYRGMVHNVNTYDKPKKNSKKKRKIKKARTRFIKKKIKMKINIEEGLSFQFSERRNFSWKKRRHKEILLKP